MTPRGAAGFGSFEDGEGGGTGTLRARWNARRGLEFYRLDGVAGPTRARVRAMTIQVRDLGPPLWPDYEKLFGKNGACGGCWCMSWRVKKGEKWAELKGDKAKRRMRALIGAGEAHGVLAYVDGEPVGWCAYGRRTEFSRLDRAPSLACDDAEKVWSLPCFYVKNGFRGQGVAKAMLDASLAFMKKRGARLAEGYPVKPAKSGEPIPAAFAWTGTRPLFSHAGFEVVGNRDGGKQRVRRAL